MDSDKSSDITPRIREERIRVGLSQQELAEKLGVTRQTVSNLENGRTLPNLAVVFAIAAILGVFWFKLYEGKGGRNSGEHHTEGV